MAVKLMNVKDPEQYWERLCVNLSYLNRYLQGKAEYGSCASERGVQHTVLFTAQKTAEERNLNVNLVSVLCQAVALCFPARGLAELAVIKELIRTNHPAEALETLEIDAIEYAVYESGSAVTPELDALLHKYYSDDESVPEVNLVRFLQKYLNLNRGLLCGCSFAASGQIVGEIMTRAKAEYERSYRLLPDPIPQPLPQNVREEIEENLATFLEYYKDIPTALYEVMI